MISVLLVPKKEVTMTNKKSVDDLIKMAKSVTAQAAANGDSTTTPEMMDAIQSVAAQIKRMSGTDSELAALVDQVL